jgi:hypothetical protein
MDLTNRGQLGRRAAALLLVTVVSACGAGPAPAAQPAPARSVTALQESTSSSGRASPSSSLGRPAPSWQLTVPLEIAQRPDGAPLAPVPVSINGKAPFAFALDYRRVELDRR